LSGKDIGKTITLCGWVQVRRDHGGVIFVDLRDRYGLTQVVFDPKHNAGTHKEAEHLGREWVLQVSGKVRARPAGMENPKMPTGAVELAVDKLVILNKAETPPIEIEDSVVAGEESRLRHRYLDLRRPVMQKQLLVRHKTAQTVRQFLSENSFVEIETPMFVKTTPGGARVFKVPSRVHPGKFYALPESPQMYKQLLMVAGFDRYFQIVRCMRDEDLRADRQPEFTQIDMEMSFIDEADIQGVVERLLQRIWKDVLGVSIKIPFERLSFHDAMMRFGSDKPDLRFGLEFVDVTKIAAKSGFSVFSSAVEKKGIVLCLNAAGSNFTRKDIDDFVELAKNSGLGGLAWARMAGGKLESSIVKYLSDGVQSELIKAAKAKDGDVLFFAAGEFEKTATALGVVRNEVGRRLKLIKDGFRFCWVVDVPLFEMNEETGKWQARHHIFTSPKDSDISKLEKAPAEVLAKAYDCVLNGVELGGGSIRVHSKEVQERTLQVTGLTYDDAVKKFDFLLNAFRFGAPPHGGIAIGFDRLCALMQGISDIREVIAFPKTKNAENPMDGSPQPWSEEWLRELGLRQRQ